MQRPWRSTSCLASSTHRGALTLAVAPVSAPRARPLELLVPWLLLTPALAPLVVLVVVPYAGALLYSLTDATLGDIASPPFVGLRNFELLGGMSQPPFRLIAEATAVFTIGTVVGSLSLGTLLALALASVSPRRRAPLLAVFLIPWIIAGVVIGYAWKLVYDPQLGLANAILAMFHIGPVAWLIDRWLAIGVRTNGAATDYVTLNPRQFLSSAPYAITFGFSACEPF